MEKSKIGIAFDAYLKGAERGDGAGRMGALRAMLGIAPNSANPITEALSLVSPEKLWRCKVDPAQDYSSSLQRERMMMQQAVHMCAFMGFRADEHERATICTVRVLILELMPDALRPCAKASPKMWKSKEYMAARQMFEMMQPSKFNIDVVSITGLGMTRSGLDHMIEAAYTTFMCGGF